MGRIGKAERCAHVFVNTVGTRWCGKAAAGPADYVNWLVDVSYLSEEREFSRLRDGLKGAGLSA
jgi:hypothetical protein